MEEDEIREDAARAALQRAKEITIAALKAEKAMNVVFWIRNYGADALRSKVKLTYEPGYGDSYYGSKDAQSYVLDAIAAMMPEIYARAKDVAEQQLDEIVLLTARDSDRSGEAGETRSGSTGGESAGLEEASPTPGIHQEHT